MTDDRTDSISNSSDSNDENIDVRMDSVESVNVNDYVLCEFEVGKKTKYLVGKVMKEEDEDGDILFCKRVGKLVDKFLCQTVEDIGKVRNGQIKTILPQPVNCKAHHSITASASRPGNNSDKFLNSFLTSNLSISSLMSTIRVRAIGRPAINLQNNEVNK
ncbi:pogo transposable element with krab domain [Biomphalaria glabrata]